MTTMPSTLPWPATTTRHAARSWPGSARPSRPGTGSPQTSGPSPSPKQR
ncbi:hypothetical protein NKH77_50330 [Streptomyces sp. M19]